MVRMDENMPFLLQYENVAWYENGKVRILDRRIYPTEVRFVECATYQEVVQAIADMEAPYARAPFPNVYSTEDEVSTISMYLTDLTTYVDERAVAFICGYASIEDEFDSYIETLKGMQVEELIKVKQAQYDRYAAALK